MQVKDSSGRSTEETEFCQLDGKLARHQSALFFRVIVTLHHFLLDVLSVGTESLKAASPVELCEHVRPPRSSAEEQGKRPVYWVPSWA